MSNNLYVYKITLKKLVYFNEYINAYIYKICEKDITKIDNTKKKLISYLIDNNKPISKIDIFLSLKIVTNKNGEENTLQHIKLVSRNNKYIKKNILHDLQDNLPKNIKIIYKNNIIFIGKSHTSIEKYDIMNSLIYYLMTGIFSNSDNQTDILSHSLYRSLTIKNDLTFSFDVKCSSKPIIKNVIDCSTNSYFKCCNYSKNKLLYRGIDSYPLAIGSWFSECVSTAYMYSNNENTYNGYINVYKTNIILKLFILSNVSNINLLLQKTFKDESLIDIYKILVNGFPPSQDKKKKMSIKNCYQIKNLNRASFLVDDRKLLNYLCDIGFDGYISNKINDFPPEIALCDPINSVRLLSSYKLDKKLSMNNLGEIEQNSKKI